MSLRQDQLQVLSILSKNLTAHPPQLVPTEVIACKIDMQLPQLQQLLKNMNGIGIIQTDDDLQYNLITRKGLNYLSERHLYTPDKVP